MCAFDPPFSLLSFCVCVCVCLYLSVYNNILFFLDGCAVPRKRREDAPLRSRERELSIFVIDNHKDRTERQVRRDAQRILVSLFSFGFTSGIDTSIRMSVTSVSL